ncbi:MAG: hypothetical protein U0263_39790 [Polyangiaceae bacterium]
MPLALVGEPRTVLVLGVPRPAHSSCCVRTASRIDWLLEDAVLARVLGQKALPGLSAPDVSWRR